MAFDLGAMLKDVPNLDTAREQIEYIQLDLLDGDGKNFYGLSEIEALANNIATIGLQQPLRLRKHPEEEGRYMVVSGHRRRAALQLLVQEDPERWSEVPCIVDRDTVSPALQQLRLIFGNANTRKMSSSDLSEQAAQVEKLLYQLKEEGYEFPGRMRDHVAQVVQVSKTKLARLKMIRDNLAPCWQPDYQKGVLDESPAYELSRMPTERQILLYEEKQRIGANIKYLYADDIKRFSERASTIMSLSCAKSGGFPCINADRKLRKTAVADRYGSYYCDKCCSECYHLTSCKNACPRLEDKIAKLKASAREECRQAKQAQEAKDRPIVEKLRQLWHRFGLAREQAEKSVQEVFAAAKMFYAKTDDQKTSEYECGSAKFTTSTTLPYGYSCRLSDVEHLIAVAELFGCSIDYLLCRTDVREVAQEGSPGKVSESGTGEQPGVIPGVWYPSSVEPPLGTNVILIDNHGFVDDAVYEGRRCFDSVYITSLDEVKMWSLFPGEGNAPEEDHKNGTPPALNNSCKTGMSPSGHCGSAAVCGEPVDCCLNCDKDCNLRCGWMEDIEHGLSVSDN